MTALIEARGVTKVFGGGLFDRNQVVALRDLSFALGTDPPRITAVVGESGSGKTTLARLLLGLDEPTTGEITYRGVPMRRLTRAQRRAFLGDVQVIFQDPYEVYNPFYTVDHVLKEPIARFKLADSKAGARQLIEETLAKVGLRPEETLGRHPHELSGGQRQRVMVARALLLRPQVIVADEPVSMLDASLRATILRTIQMLNRDAGIAFLYITHDLTTAYQISDRILVLYRGQVVEAGEARRVVREPRHPYTELLVGSVPLPNPDRAWRGDVRASRDAAPATAHSCPFVDRCPQAMPACRREQPPLYRPEARRAVACYLHSDAPTLPRGQLDDLFATEPGPAPRSAAGR